MRILRHAQTAHTPTRTDPGLTPAVDSLARGIRSHSPRQPLPMLRGLRAQPGWLASLATCPQSSPSPSSPYKAGPKSSTQLTDTPSQPAGDSMLGPQPQLNYNCHMDALRGGSHRLAAWVQLPPGHPLVRAVLLGSWLLHGGTTELLRCPSDPEHQLHLLTSPQASPLMGMPWPAPT